ncbi:(2Fe-2S)-binding protein [Frigidibacter sp.]|uniref:(2Fe-2S)-binding protein n=1 Tax=Frigidibacter sp. TaxID=2586418 RepID=UPI00273741CE|nr:(2Fe-2S)-binding protein [Frigidibacter sp.]MDP3342358.1 (2Fe-2S)-binding protein [Frigidibacter sp.]
MPALTVTVDGIPVELRQGDTVATAVLMAGHAVYRRTLLDDAPRAPFCMMGVCFDCLVEVDGVANCQGCLMPAREGMRICRQIGLATGQPGGEGPQR